MRSRRVYCRQGKHSGGAACDHNGSCPSSPHRCARLPAQRLRCPWPCPWAWPWQACRLRCRCRPAAAAAAVAAVGCPPVSPHPLWTPQAAPRPRCHPPPHPPPAEAAHDTVDAQCMQAGVRYQETHMRAVSPPWALSDVSIRLQALCLGPLFQGANRNGTA